MLCEALRGPVTGGMILGVTMPGNVSPLSVALCGALTVYRCIHRSRIGTNKGDWHAFRSHIGNLNMFLVW